MIKILKNQMMSFIYLEKNNKERQARKLLNKIGSNLGKKFGRRINMNLRKMGR